MVWYLKSWGKSPLPMDHDHYSHKMFFWGYSHLSEKSMWMNDEDWRLISLWAFFLKILWFGAVFCVLLLLFFGGDARTTIYCLGLTGVFSFLEDWWGLALFYSWVFNGFLRERHVFPNLQGSSTQPFYSEFGSFLDRYRPEPYAR